MKLTIGFSPCPNDTFIFDALVNGKIDLHGLEFEPVLADVQQLNEWAKTGTLDVTKVSTGVLPEIWHSYRILDAGGALGKGVGPLLITRAEWKGVDPNDTQHFVAIPGENTTANMLFDMAFPGYRKKRFMIFSGIEDALLNKAVDFGVIIHENRFTYANRGLYLVKDLGSYWEGLTGLPLPLGVITAKKTLGPEIGKQLSRIIHESVNYAGQHSVVRLPDFVTQHAAEMDPEVMRSHIALYVNEYSKSMGSTGQKAIRALLKIVQKSRPGTGNPPEDLFAD